jgi:hypothetical protein
LFLFFLTWYWYDSVFCVLISVCAKQYLWDDLEDRIIDAVFKTETFASSAGINFLYWSVRNSENFTLGCHGLPQA